VLELTHRQVEPDRAATVEAHPAGALSSARADLEHVLAGDVPEHAGVVLRQTFRAPHEAGVAEEVAVRGLVLVGVTVPVGTIGPTRLLLAHRPAFDPHALR